MAEDLSKNLPFSTFGIVKPSTFAYARGFRFDFKLHDNRSIQFFGLIILDNNEEVNAKVADEIVSRIKDTVTYQKDLLAGNKISITNEDFFEQCLQKANNELGIFLRDIDISLSLQTWSVLIGMITESPSPLKSELYLSRFGEVTGWLLHSAQLDTKKLISIFDTPDLLAGGMIPQKFFSSIIATEVSVNDQLFFCTPNLLNHVSLSEIKHVLSTLSAQSGLKHLENQINFSPSDRVVASLTIRLSPYPVLEQDTQPSFNNSAESSMDNLIHTQSETEKLLGNGVGVSFSRLADTAKGAMSQIVTKAKRPDSEIVPGNTNQREKTGATKVLAIIIRYTSKSVNALQRTSLFLLKKTPATRKTDLDSLATNQTITKVNILKKQLADTLSPLTNRLNFYKSSSNKSNFFKLLRKPVSIVILSVLLIAFIGARYTKNQYDTKQAILAQSEATLEEIGTNLDQIDSYLIVGRESDAILLLQESVTSLATVEGEEFTERVAAFSEKLEQRQSTLRKETIVTNAEIILDNLSTTLPSPTKQLLQVGPDFLVLSENPKASILSSQPADVKNITTDLSSYLGADYINNTLVYLDDTAISQGTLESEAFQSTAVVSNPGYLSAANYNNRLYTLAPESNQIFRSNPAPGFSSLTSWLREANANLSGARDLGIDGSIYVLFADKVDLYNQGFAANPNITLDAVEPALSNAQKIWLSDASNKLYILEPNRLLEYEKSGRFRQQYLIPNSTFKDVHIEPQQRTAYLLTENQLLKINL
jgi:hypothetical protein